MYLYLLEQNENDDHETYKSCVVCAENSYQAKKIHPNGDDIWTNNSWGGKDKPKYWGKSSWCSSPDKVRCRIIGLAKDGLKKGVVLASITGGW